MRVVLGTEGASSLSSVFTLCNSAVGAGVLSLPYAFQCAGEWMRASLLSSGCRLACPPPLPPAGSLLLLHAQHAPPAVTPWCPPPPNTHTQTHPHTPAHTHAPT
jgi:hypothetical protein